MLRQIKLTGEGRVAILGPYSEDFADKARKMSARWDEVTGAGKRWCFPDGAHLTAVAAALSVYGVIPATRDETRHRSVRIRVDEGWSVRTGPVVVLGYELAVARGRDSGARPGEGVSILDGTIGSSGSAKNWYSTVATGVEALLRDFPVSWMDALKRESGIQILEVVPAESHVTATPATPATVLGVGLTLIEMLNTHGLTADVDALAALIRPKGERMCVTRASVRVLPAALLRDVRQVLTVSQIRDRFDVNIEDDLRRLGEHRLASRLRAAVKAKKMFADDPPPAADDVYDLSREYQKKD